MNTYYIFPSRHLNVVYSDKKNYSGIYFCHVMVDYVWVSFSHFSRFSILCLCPHWRYFTQIFPIHTALSICFTTQKKLTSCSALNLRNMHPKGSIILFNVPAASTIFSVFKLWLPGFGIYSFTSILGSPPQPFMMMWASVGFVWSLWFPVQVKLVQILMSSCYGAAACKHSTVKCSQRPIVWVFIITGFD